MATLFVIAEDYKTTQVSINMEQVKSTLGSPHNGTLRAIKKEGGEGHSSCTNMEFPPPISLSENNRCVYI